MHLSPDPLRVSRLYRIKQRLPARVGLKTRTVSRVQRLQALVNRLEAVLPGIGQRAAAERRKTGAKYHGCVESVLRSADPSLGDLILNIVSLDYSHTRMAASGTAAA